MRKLTEICSNFDNKKTWISQVLYEIFVNERLLSAKCFLDDKKR